MTREEHLKNMPEIFFLLVAGAVFLCLAYTGADIYLLALLYGALLTFHYFRKSTLDDDRQPKICTVCLIAVYIILCVIFPKWLSFALFPYLLCSHVFYGKRKPLFLLIIIPDLLYITITCLYEYCLKIPVVGSIPTLCFNTVLLSLNSTLALAIFLVTQRLLLKSENARNVITAAAVNEFLELADYRDRIIKQYIVEQNIRLEERERISLKIHNVVGHTIITAIMALDAADILFDTDIDKARDKIAIARESISQGLDVVRQAVRSIDDENESLTGTRMALILLTDVEQFTFDMGMKINHNLLGFFSDRLIPRELANFLSEAMPELLSNSRHSNATVYTVRLDMDDANIQLSVSDNGDTFSELTETERRERLKNGFGLKKIGQQVSRVGGDLCFGFEDGFSVELKIPLAK